MKFEKLQLRKIFFVCRFYEYFAIKYSNVSLTKQTRQGRSVGRHVSFTVAEIRVDRCFSQPVKV